ncbi:MAG: 16S rRNA (guanine(527)-N(7))-methyltransferase RsmG [Eubacteriaceae bacterium]|nr:16S rRNA (guanine(527)-N(7))-methyltransferase RsmG [Eubacteriaceae bacterium]
MDISQKKSMLVSGAESLGIGVSDDQAERLLAYMELVLEKNRVMNLTAIKDEERFIYLNLVDSLSALRVLPEAGTLIDVGTGAGLPGIVAAVMRSDLNVTLMDATEKKLRFLEEVTAKLGIANASILCGRAEELSRDPRCRDSFDAAVSRAVARLPLLMEYVLPFVRKGGIFVAMKGAEAAEELEEARNITALLSASFSSSDELVLPGGEEARCLLVFEKTAPTSEAYPRRNSVLKKLYSNR